MSARRHRPTRNRRSSALRAALLLALLSFTAACQTPPGMTRTRDGVNEYTVVATAADHGGAAGARRRALQESYNTCATLGHYTLIVSEVADPAAYRVKLRCDSLD
ncbi:MAG TPA: hypothetical protein PKA20_24940 [Burkholderiaceae bacterium]|nr:hypothetical protein [Burkholderiaceae bacterium]